MKPIVIAHRGASGYLPEHTRPAKVLAHIMGADFLEQDIVATRDNQLVVLHAIQLDEVTDVAIKFPDRKRADGRYYARDFDLDEIRTLFAWERMKSDGSAVYPNRYPAKTGRYRVHTFREEMQLINRLNNATGREAGIYAEIKRPAWHKHEGIDISPMVLDEIREFDGSDNTALVYVQCFDDAEVQRLKTELACPWPLVQLIDRKFSLEADTDYGAMAKEEGLAQVANFADGVGPHISWLYSSDEEGIRSSKLAENAHKLGLFVHPFTFRSDDLPPGFDSLEDLVRFCVTELMVDGLFTDFTDQVVEILNRIDE